MAKEDIGLMLKNCVLGAVITIKPRNDVFTLTRNGWLWKKESMLFGNNTMVSDLYEFGGTVRDSSSAEPVHISGTKEDKNAQAYSNNRSNI